MNLVKWTLGPGDLHRIRYSVTIELALDPLKKPLDRMNRLDAITILHQVTYLALTRLKMGTMAAS